MKKVSFDAKEKFKHYSLIALKSYVGYKVLFYLLLGFVPKAHELYMNFYSSHDDILPADKQKNIRPMREMHGIHTFNDMQPIIANLKHDEGIIFKNFHDCEKKFDNIIYPRRKDQVEAFTVSVPRKGTRGNLYVSGRERASGTIDKSLEELLNEADTKHYASFLQMFDNEDYRDILNADNQTNFTVDSSFISHYPHGMIGSPIHAAGGVETYSAQCYGVKSWMFYSVADLNKHGFITMASPQGIVINGSPDSLSRVPATLAVVYPGDVLYFPPFYYHAVATTPGKNIMFAIRKLHKGSIVKSFKTSYRMTVLALSQSIFRKLYGKIVGVKGKITVLRSNEEYVPFKSEHLKLWEKQIEAFIDADGLDDFKLPEKW